MPPRILVNFPGVTFDPDKLDVLYAEDYNYLVEQFLLLYTVLLQTNGSTNSVQNLLNLLAGTNISLSESGGAVTINNTLDIGPLMTAVFGVTASDDEIYSTDNTYFTDFFTGFSVWFSRAQRFGTCRVTFDVLLTEDVTFDLQVIHRDITDHHEVVGVTGLNSLSFDSDIFFQQDFGVYIQLPHATPITFSNFKISGFPYPASLNQYVNFTMISGALS